MRRQVADDDLDARLIRIASRQHGVISVAQLRQLGISWAALDRRLRAGRLHRLHRGVYAVGHTGLAKEGRWMAAVLAIGVGAVLSHRSAAELWGIASYDRRPVEAGGHSGNGTIEVTVPSTSGRSPRAGISLHRSLTLSPDDCTRRLGVPVTKPARTLDDLRRALSQPELGTAIKQAEYIGLPLGARFGSQQPHSELEARMLALCRRHRIPKPEMNVRVDRYVVDFLWRARRLIAEVDGWTAHRSRSAFEDDRARDAHLKVLGFEVVRFTWRQVSDDGPLVARTIRVLLSGRST